MHAISLCNTRAVCDHGTVNFAVTLKLALPSCQRTAILLGSCMGFLRGDCAASAHRLTLTVVKAAIVTLIDGLPAAARKGDAAVTLHARRLTTALQV